MDCLSCGGLLRVTRRSSGGNDSEDDEGDEVDEGDGGYGGAFSLRDLGRGLFVTGIIVLILIVVCEVAGDDEGPRGSSTSYSEPRRSSNRSMNPQATFVRPSAQGSTATTSTAQKPTSASPQGPESSPRPPTSNGPRVKPTYTPIPMPTPTLAPAPIPLPDYKIAFINAGEAGSDEVHFINPDGSGLRQVTSYENTSARDKMYPRWSPDGRQIAFTGRDDDYVPRIWVINADGTNERIIPTQNKKPNSRVDWSPDGQQIVFNYYSYLLQSVHNDGSNGKVRVESSSGMSLLSWSSRDELAFLKEYDIVIWDPNTSIETILVSGSELGYQKPTSLAWSPLGDRLVFALPVDNGDIRVPRIYTADRSGGNIRRIGSPDMCPGATISCSSERSPTWSPDSTQVAFFVEGDMNVKGLWVMDSNGSNRKKIWTDETKCCQASKGLSWSPTKIPQ